MDKIEALENLLPGFQEFLSDLALINLTTGLKEKLLTYQRRIDDYIEQHSTAPMAPLPPVPTVQQNGEIDVEKLREQSWRQSGAPTESWYQNTQEEGPSDVYEEPMISVPPKLPPVQSRPPIHRIIDENDDFYEDPDDRESGRGSMPPGSCSDEGSGGTFTFNRPGDAHDEEWDTDSTDYEDMEEQDTRTIETKQKKKVDKLQEFKDAHANDTDVDQIDRLFYYNNMISTIKGGISLGKWEKRYCIARDGQLFLHKSSKDKKAVRLPLMGYDVWSIGQQTGKDNVFRINHHSMKHPLLLSADTKAKADNWVETLKRYATIDHTIMPTTGLQVETIDEPDESPKKAGKLFSKDKKEKELHATPQITADSAGNISGYVNIFGAKFGDPKVKRKWVSIQDMAFKCSASKDEPPSFTFNMKGIQIEVADKKEVKMKGAFKLTQDGATLLYIEALNTLDTGTLLKKLVAATAVGQKTDSKTSTESPEKTQAGMVAKLLAAFENQSSSGGESGDGTVRLSTVISPSSSEDQTYDDIAAPEQNYVNSTVLTPPPEGARRVSLVEKIFKTGKSSSVEEPSLYDDASSGPASPPPAEEIYDDVDVGPTTPAKDGTLSRILPQLKKKDKDKDKGGNNPPASPSTDPKAEKKETDKERKAREKKEKKERKDKEKEEKKKRKKEKENKESEVSVTEEEAPPTPKTPETIKTPEAPVVEKKEEAAKKSPNLQRKPSAQNKFHNSEMSHLLLKDKLMQERKEVEEQKKEITTRKINLRAKMNAATDPQEKEKLKQQVDAVQNEWSVINKKLANISEQIEAATGGNKDTNSNRVGLEKSKPVPRSSVRSTSPDREKVNKGTVQDRMKMFQQT